ncbi:MAG: hypothetical protein DMF75_00945 [Acidobacteria bacterium]|nr:MAG: hypothetical protein DMF75_00945 [Acidobacteriota bacterium]
MQLRSSFVKACLLVFALITIGARLTPGQANQSTPPVARRAQPPVPAPQYIPPHDYDQRNIKLDLKFDWEREQAIGVATITLAPTVKDLRRLDFDAAYMTISGATLSPRTTLKWDYDVSKERLSVQLDRANARDLAVVV